MKRFEIMIATDRGEKKVSVCVSNEVALMLQACPKGIRIMYKDQMVVLKEYDKIEDYQLLKGEQYSFIEYQKGQAVVCDINQPHMASGAIDEERVVLKAIVKIPASLKNK